MTKQEEIMELDEQLEEEVAQKTTSPKKKSREIPLEHVTIQTVDPSIAKRQRDAERMRQADAEWKHRLETDKKIALKTPKYYAHMMSPFYVFMYNDTPVVVRLDGTTQYFPETIYRKVVEKLGTILDSHISESQIDEL